MIKDEKFMIKECDAIVGTIKPKLFGKHNLMNIVSAFSALRSLGFDSKRIFKAINQFNGVKRRLQHLPQFQKNHVFDDFAHHPTSIKFGIAAVKERHPNRKLCVLAELASNTMRQGTLKDEVVNSFSRADSVFILFNDDFEWDIEDAFKSSESVNIVKSNEDLINNLELLNTDEYNFLIMTNKTSIPFIQALEVRLKKSER
jgi:UDP-N-acetylmuramate: L-alanyl-gamma-D-glutamyl-meso-diaminopimelate ligase